MLDEIERGLRAIHQDASPAAGLDAGAREMAERIKNTQFRITRRAHGYDERAVDLFLDKLVQTLSRGERPNPGDLRTIEFPPAHWRPGYARQDVDDLLNAVRRYAAGDN